MGRLQERKRKMERVLEKLKTAVVKQCELIPAFIDKKEREGKKYV